jgi:calcineurin-like phosphoesterase family protein
MNEVLLTRHNELVKPQDHVYFLGDVTMLRGGRIERERFIKEIRKYNGHKRLFLGNHDHWPTKIYLEAGFEKIYATWRDDENIIYSHFPLHPHHMGKVIANVHGHIHQNKSPEPVMWIDKKKERISYIPYINVSVEAIDYRPVNLDQLKAMINKEKGEYEGVKVGTEVIVSPVGNSREGSD